MPSYVSQLRYAQGIYNIAALAGSLDGRGHMIWAGEERCFEPNSTDAARWSYGGFNEPLALPDHLLQDDIKTLLNEDFYARRA